MYMYVHSTFTYAICKKKTERRRTQCVHVYFSIKKRIKFPSFPFALVTLLMTMMMMTLQMGSTGYNYKILLKNKTKRTILVL